MTRSDQPAECMWAAYAVGVDAAGVSVGARICRSLSRRRPKPVRSALPLRRSTTSPWQKGQTLDFMWIRDQQCQQLRPIRNLAISTPMGPRIAPRAKPTNQSPPYLTAATAAQQAQTIDVVARAKARANSGMRVPPGVILKRGGYIIRGARKRGGGLIRSAARGHDAPQSGALLVAASPNRCWYHPSGPGTA